MPDLVRIHNTDITPLESEGQRVITLDMMDTVHERPTGTAGRTFRKNQARLREGKHYFRRSASEAHQLGITAPNGLVLLSETGYLMLVKSFRDELAWQIQEQLIDGYFRAFAPAGLPKVHDHRTEIAIQTLVRLDEAEHRLALMERAEQERQAALIAIQAKVIAGLEQSQRAESKADLVIDDHRMTIEEFVLKNGLLVQFPPPSWKSIATWLTRFCLDYALRVEKSKVVGKLWPDEWSYPLQAFGRWLDYEQRKPKQTALHLIHTQER